MENKQNSQEEETDIREYINVILKRKKLILSIFLAAVTITAVVNLRKPKIYEIISTIQLGNVNEVLIKKEDAKAIMLNRTSLWAAIKELNLKTGVDELQGNIKISEIKDTNLLKIQITYPDIDMVFKLSDAIVNPFINQGQAVYRQRLSLVSERLKELDQEINNAESDIIRIQAIISETSKSSNFAQADVYLRVIVLQSNLSNYESSLSALRNQRNGLKLLLDNSKDFKVFDAPIRPRGPLGVKLAQNVLSAGLVSIIFSILLVFFIELFQKPMKSEDK